MSSRINLDLINNEVLIFTKKFNKLSNCFLNENNTNIVLCNNIYKTKLILRTIKNTISFCLINKISIRKYFRDKSHKPMIKKSSFYQWIKKIIKFSKINKNNFLKFVLMSKRPKNIKYLYSKDERKQIADIFFKKPSFKNNFQTFNKFNVWFKVRTDNKNFWNDKFRKIGLATTAKIINQDKRNTKQAKTFSKHKHPKRQYKLPIGYVQLDLKIIGPTETDLNQNIYIFDAIDEESNYYYNKVIKFKTEDEILKATKIMLDFYKSKGIKVKRIRTDNAPEFKESIFDERGKFHKFLTDNNIIHEFILPRNPQQNGKIERVHRVIDDELLPWIKTFKSLDKYKKAIEMFRNNFNTIRKRKYDLYNLISTPEEFVRKYNV